jgi:type IV fimbrial biogenesis protein FimT
MTPTPTQPPRGFTLVEMAGVLAIVSLMAAMVMPSLSQMRERALVRSLAAQVETDLHHARASAVAMNRVVRLSFGNEVAAGCYVVHTGDAADDCRCGADGQPVCRGLATVLRVQQGDRAGGARISANVRAMSFEPVRGIVTPTATIAAESASGMRVNLVVNLFGRVRSCSPAGSVEGEPRC